MWNRCINKVVSRPKVLNKLSTAGSALHIQGTISYWIHAGYQKNVYMYTNYPMSDVKILVLQHNCSPYFIPLPCVL